MKKIPFEPNLTPRLCTATIMPATVDRCVELKPTFRKHAKGGMEIGRKYGGENLVTMLIRDFVWYSSVDIV